MAKVKLKGIGKVNTLIRKIFTKDIFSKKLIKEIGEFSENRVKSFTRAGFSIAGDKKKKLKKLSSSYKDMRRGAVKFRTINGIVVPFQEPDERLKKLIRSSSILTLVI